MTPYKPVPVCTGCGRERSRGDFFQTQRGWIRQPCKECRSAALCPECGATYQMDNSKADRCPKCYGVHRQAVKLWHAAKNRAAKQRVPFDLTIEWIKERLIQPCPRTGLPLTILAKSNDYRDRPFNSPSLDQIVARGGYTTDNVQIVAWWYNAAKQQYSDDEVLSLCKMVVTKASS